ncbi:hypothetical protein MKX01_035700 [Papaver californicum]|nr:hypothetical protein MKX01_035700 [Papaver californicum]
MNLFLKLDNQQRFQFLAMLVLKMPFYKLNRIMSLYGDNISAHVQVSEGIKKLKDVAVASLASHLSASREV